MYPAPIGTGTALRETGCLQLTDQPDCPGVGQPEHISQPADVRLAEELLQRQQRSCRTAGQPRGVLQRGRCLVSKVERECRQQVL